jgi:hypothetical protein
MDGSRFDALAKALTEPGSRRRALGGVLAGALALVGGLQPEESAAKLCGGVENKKRRRKCKKRARELSRTPPTGLPLTYDACLVNEPRRLCAPYGCANRDQSFGCLACFSDVEACCERTLISPQAYCACLDSLVGFCCPC